MTEEQPTWGAVAGKTWGEIAGECEGEAAHQMADDFRSRTADDSATADPYVQEIGAKLDAQQAEIETLKARVQALELIYLPPGTIRSTRIEPT